MRGVRVSTAAAGADADGAATATVSGSAAGAGIVTTGRGTPARVLSARRLARSCWRRRVAARSRPFDGSAGFLSRVVLHCLWPASGP